MVFTEPADLHYEFGVPMQASTNNTYEDCTLEERLVLLNIKLGINRDEEILAKSKLSPGEFARTTMTLQLKNLIKSVGNGEWALV